MAVLKIITRLASRYFPSTLVMDDGIAYWRERLFIIIMMIALPVGSLIFIPNIIMAISDDLLFIASYDTLALLVILGIFFSRQVHFQVRKTLLIANIYCLATVLIVLMGSYGPGLIFLLGVSIFTVLLISSKAGFISVAVNLAIYACLALLIHLDSFHTQFFVEYSTGSWLAIGANMIAINLAVVSSIAVLIEGLKNTISLKDIVQKQLREETQQLKIAQKKAEESDQLKSMFLSNISHEIRTPLNSIIGFTEILANKYSTNPTSDEVNIFDWIKRSSDRLTKTVESILSMSDMVTGTLHIRPEKLSLGQVVQEIIDELKPLAHTKGLEIYFSNELSDDTLQTDRFALQNAIMNIADNAIKFTYEGYVTFRLYSANNEIHLILRDTGVGMSENALSIMFDPFRQGSEGYTKEYQGLGLGLTLAKKFLVLC